MIKKVPMKPINQKPIILASGSPRRKTLMNQAGLAFKIHVADIDESGVDVNMAPKDYVNLLSRMKAQAVAGSYPYAWTIGADTIVAVDNAILGKPRDRDEAVAMLNRLSDTDHFVYTAFTIVRPETDQMVARVIDTRVRFKKLSIDEINWYADTKEPYDKAGGYGIQGIGAFMVKEISGSYTNVVGLPVCELINVLTQIGAVSFKESQTNEH